MGASAVAAVLNGLLGVLVAWVLVRYEFPLKRLFDSLVDLPFALPTAVAGLVYSDLFTAQGWYGRFLVPLGIAGAYSRLGIVLVLVFIGFPFVVRTLQPVLELTADEHISDAQCSCNHYQQHRLRRGPCSHMLALRLVAQPKIDALRRESVSPPADTAVEEGAR